MNKNKKSKAREWYAIATKDNILCAFFDTERSRDFVKKDLIYEKINSKFGLYEKAKVIQVREVLKRKKRS